MMTPERERYLQGMTQEEFDDRVMVLYFKSQITCYKKKLNKLVKKQAGHLDTIRLCKAVIRVTKKRLVEAKKKLPNRKAVSSEVIS